MDWGGQPDCDKLEMELAPWVPVLIICWILLSIFVCLS